MAIGVVTDRNFLELHVVLRESACLVWKDVAYFAKLFIQITRLDAGLNASLLIAHVNIPLHEETLDEAHCFDGNDQRDGNKITHDNHPTTAISERVHENLDCKFVFIAIGTTEIDTKVGVRVSWLKSPRIRKIPKEEASDQLDHESCQNEPIELLFHVWVLGYCMLRVFHDLCIVARVDNHANDPLSILECRATENELVVVKVDQLWV